MFSFHPSIAREFYHQFFCLFASALALFLAFLIRQGFFNLFILFLKRSGFLFLSSRIAMNSNNNNQKSMILLLFLSFFVNILNFIE